MQRLAATILLAAFPFYSHGQQYSPNGRIGHISTMVNNQIFFYGGQTNSGTSGSSSGLQATNDLFILDTTNNFNVTSPPWKNMLSSLAPDSAPVPAGYDGYAAPAINDGGDAVFMSGVTQASDASFCYAMHQTGLQFEAPVQNGRLPHRCRRGSASTSSTDLTVVLFGGFQDEAVGVSTLTFTNKVWALAPLNWTWTEITPTTGPAPDPMADHTAAHLPDGRMVVIGGRHANGTLADMNNIWIWNPFSVSNYSMGGFWSIQPTTGSTPDSRYGHTMTVVNSTQLLVYGGAGKVCDADSGTNPTSLVTATVTNATTTTGCPMAQTQVAVLDTTKSPMEWSAPQIAAAPSLGQPPASRYKHTSSQLGQYMVSTFGSLGSEGSVLQLDDQLVHVLNTATFQWVDNFDAQTASSIANGAPIVLGPYGNAQVTLDPTPAIVGGVIGGIVLIVGAVVFFTWKNKKTQDST